MKKVYIICLIFILTACSSTDSNINNATNDNLDNNISTTTTVKEQISNDSTTTSVQDGYVFDKEKMSPFTGLELPPELWLKRPRRVLAFKIDNNFNARPQSGLNNADAIYEILVEGGMTRFLAFFYDKTSDYLGPIRSARPTDPTLVKPYGGVLIVSGATPGLVPQIRELGVAVLEEQTPPEMFRITSREAPHNLYGDTELIRKLVDTKGFPFNPPAEPLYSFGTDQDNWSTGANRVTIKYSEFTTITWKLDGLKYLRFITDGYSNTTEPVAHNVVDRDNDIEILETETIAVIQGANYLDEATTLPSVLTVGVGAVFIFSKGNYIEGTWRRNDINEPFDFYDEQQNPIYVPPSKQWIHILPLNDGQVTWSSS